MTTKEELDRDLLLYGISFEIDGKRVHPERVKVAYLKDGGQRFDVDYSSLIAPAAR